MAREDVIRLLATNTMNIFCTKPDGWSDQLGQSGSVLMGGRWLLDHFEP